MRILHTSDWHVGRSFHGRDLLSDQEQVLASIAALVAERAIDVVLVAGDLYDRALPSAEAVGVCHRALRLIRDAGASIVVISGNHDSASRLGFGAEFLAAGGLYVRSDPARVGSPVLLADSHGEVAVYGVPYLEPDTARHALGDPEARGHEGVLRVALAAVRADLAERPGVRSVLLAHAFVVGGEGCESERTISVGGIETVPAALFDGLDYVALGHLHGVQQPDATRPWLRYSGSPLAYSFSEARQRKSVLIAELGAGGLDSVSRVELPIPRALSSLTGTLEGLLSDPEHAFAEDHYVAAVLTDPARPLDALRRLQTRFPHAVTLEWQPLGGRPESGPPLAAVTRRDDTEVAVSFVSYVRNTGADQSERDLLGAAFEAQRVAEAAR
ncbi:MAG: Exodeoxyribonuclease subunit [Actinomycetia bacterium]|jgi:exonuclease SbcD|nr:Exodeoxyribonuclease subunit [Actinomycetes bacterium]MDQ1656549.1 repair protein SbcD/Mre11 [Cryptosporangiaceae bacterium]